MDIFDLPSRWRRDMMPASFRGAMFHVEAGSRENGRRIIVHEFPKKNEPYAEDMGRSAYVFTVRAYCITYPHETGIPLYDPDYRVARNILIDALEREGPGMLQLPTLPPMAVVCLRYRLTEEEKAGGYCTFDIQFAESGKSPFQERQNPGAALEQRASELAQDNQQYLAKTLPEITPPFEE